MGGKELASCNKLSIHRCLHRSRKAAKPFHHTDSNRIKWNNAWLIRCVAEMHCSSRTSSFFSLSYINQLTNPPTNHLTNQPTIVSNIVISFAFLFSFSFTRCLVIIISFSLFFLLLLLLCIPFLLIASTLKKA